MRKGGRPCFILSVFFWKKSVRSWAERKGEGLRSESKLEKYIWILGMGFN